MRFIKDGPAIPDNLLIARDEGRVVFFCGAGVSRARAGLSNFIGLADDVIHRLGVPTSSTACKIINEATELDKRIGETGLIPVDRIFGLLEREFSVRDIETAVANALRPTGEVNLSAHQILLELATTPEGKLRLVTTNFDRLFEDCSGSQKIWQPPRLPDPSFQGEFDGIIHLHGLANSDYSGASGDGFILSSSDFGLAYLSEAWATRFIREVINLYVVVFVGYSADDPPIHYLLEALNRKTNRLDEVYAFQSDNEGGAAAKWFQRGVKAIPYSASGGHFALWQTLAEWAERAKDPDKWYKSVIDLAMKGPEQLQPFERGQVAHVVSTIEGARKFTQAVDPPPADWLCVFDPYQRYAKPSHSWKTGAEGIFIDPFELYGLDDDSAPEKIDPGSSFAKREIPQGAWDGFAPQRLDRQNLSADSYAALRGHWPVNVPRLPSRLAVIGSWIAKVADQPAAVWWAANQLRLHPSIIFGIEHQLDRSKTAPCAVRKAWEYLFETWNENRNNFDRGWYKLEAKIEREGWSNAAIRKFIAINRPFIKVEHNYLNGPKPPEWDKNIKIQDLLNLDVEYPEPMEDVNFPDEWLPAVVRGFRNNLEHALQLETELGGYGLSYISPIIPDQSPDIDVHERNSGLSGSVILFSSLFERLVKFDIKSAKQEFEAWQSQDDTIFARLRIWASGKSELISIQAFGAIIEKLSHKAFWDSRHQRDLLIVLAKRWGELPELTKKEIENRIIQGRTKWHGESETEFIERKARATLERLYWLANQGCQFTFDLEVETKDLMQLAPEWKPEYAQKAAQSMEGRGGLVRTVTEHSVLIGEPIDNLLSKAWELSERQDSFLQRNDPFSGLSAEKPVRAFVALIHSAKRGEYPEWAWRTFLTHENRKGDKPKFSALIAERILRFPDFAIAELIRPISNWLMKISEPLAATYVQTHDGIVSKLIGIIQNDPSIGKSSILRSNSEPDWVMEAINAPAGKIAQALFSDPRKNNLKFDEGFPPDWLKLVDNLLSLRDDPRHHVLVIFAYQMNWFYAINSDWTENSMLSVLDNGDESEKSAIWAGFLWRAAAPNQNLFMRLKPKLLELTSKGGITRRKYGNILSGIILVGWGSTNEATAKRYVSNFEMRDFLLHSDDGIRSHVLRQIERWSAKKENAVSQRWSAMLPEFLREVWPRQIAAKTPNATSRLFDLAFSNAERFPEIAEIILPLLTTIDRDNLTHINLHNKSMNTIVDSYPKQTLAILHAVLPENVSAWPFDIENALQRIGSADESLRLDERLIELNRKWNSR